MLTAAATWPQGTGTVVNQGGLVLGSIAACRDQMSLSLFLRHTRGGLFSTCSHQPRHFLTSELVNKNGVQTCSVPSFNLLALVHTEFQGMRAAAAWGPGLDNEDSSTAPTDGHTFEPPWTETNNTSRNPSHCIYGTEYMAKVPPG